MGVVLPQAMIERSIRVRELVDELQIDAEELKKLIAQERLEDRRNERGGT